MGGKTEVETPSMPMAQSASSSVQDWVNALPQIYEAQMKYAPMEAQQQVDLASQYAGQYGEAMKTAQEAMYPEETAFNKQALAQAQTGMEQGLPDWAKQSYMDTMRAQLGENAMAGVGADYMSRGLMEQQKSWQDYYTNLGLSISGKQPVYTAQQPQTSNYMSSFTPQSVMSYNSSNYAPYASGYSSMYNTNAQIGMQSAQQPFLYMQGIGNLLQGAGSFMGSLPGGKSTTHNNSSN